MATRSTISFFNDDGSLDTLMCFYNGYISGVGQDLLIHYSNKKDAKSLISIGDFPTVENTLEETKRKADRHNAPAVHYDNFRIFLSELRKYDAEYHYVYYLNNWHLVCGPSLMKIGNLIVPVPKK